MGFKVRSGALWIAALTVPILYGAALIWVRRMGFLAVSDDDYSRVVIAQHFEAAPSLDPSGTSWLPLPFWVMGSAMRLLEPTLAVARSASMTLGMASSLLLFWCGRRIGLSISASCGAALSCCFMSSSLWLGGATVPELSTAALTAAGTLSLVCPLGSPTRLVGALCLLSACASRYEAWPAAIAFSVWSAWDFLKQANRPKLDPRGRMARRWCGLGVCLIGSIFPLLWMIHGAINHRNALFFIKRVADYKRALGGSLPSFLELLSGYPRALVVLEPLPWLTLLLAPIALGVFNRGTTARAPLLTDLRLLQRPLTVSLVQLLVLVLGAARGGAPTHHPERALLAIWMTLFLGAFYLLRHNRDRPGQGSIAIIIAALTLIYSVGSNRLTQLISSSMGRLDEEEVGRFIAEHLENEDIALLTPDYGYFAIMAAAGNPARFDVIDDHDPRRKHSGGQPEGYLDSYLSAHETCFLVAPSSDASSEMLHRSGTLELYRLRKCRLD